MKLTDPAFHDEAAARAHLEKLQWPNGPVCPYCGVTGDDVTRLGGKAGEKGQVLCRPCRKKFTVTVGSIFERSHIPIHKWLLAFRLMSSSKKGMSAHQLHRSLDITYKSAWFMAHRIRESMRPTDAGGLGGENKVIEADETYVGGKAKNRAHRKTPPKKEAVVALVERDGRVRSFHVANVTAKNVREVLVTQADRKSYLMTDESMVYLTVGREFGGHGTVNHSIDEYVRGGFWHTNTVENYFSIFKRGINGVYHHVSPAHLKRYLGEFDFRYNERSGLGVEDAERTDKAIRGAKGKRLTYRRTDETRHA